MKPLRSFLVLLSFLVGCGGGGLPPGTQRILCFGDSITAGIGAAPGRGYPQVLARLTGREVIASGVPGETTDRGKGRLPGVLAKEHPDVVVLCEGGNDILRHRDVGEIRADLRGMIRACRESGARVLLVGVPRPGIPLRCDPLYIQLAEEEDVPLLRDALAVILSDRRWKADLIHPNTEGHRRLAEAVAEALAGD